MAHIHNGILLGREKGKEIVPSADTWMDLQTVIQSEMSERKILYINIYVESRKMV